MFSRYGLCRMNIFCVSELSEYQFCDCVEFQFMLLAYVLPLFL